MRRVQKKCYKGANQKVQHRQILDNEKHETIDCQKMQFTTKTSTYGFLKWIEDYDIKKTTAQLRIALMLSR